MDFEVEGVKVPEGGVVIVEDRHCTHPLIIGMYVILGCWDAVFKCPKTSPLQHLKKQKVWRDAFATCSRIEAVASRDGFLGNVRLASLKSVTVPPRSELLVWGRAKSGPRGVNYSALVEAMPDAGAIGVAKTLVLVKGGRLPLRVCNPHPYSVSLSRFEKLGRMSSIEDGDVPGAEDLCLSLVEEGVVEMSLIKTAVSHPGPELPPEVGDLSDHADLTAQQREQLRILLAKWEKVFAQHEDDFGRTNLVQHQIPTGDAAPVRERYRPIPPSLYKEPALAYSAVASLPCHK
uniref:Uncharacterized protein n=1 Tax=Knipowitschia caucasica TaxID=637954 RepID=A0AAV2MR25_KNICA